MSSCTLCSGESESEIRKCAECGDPFCYRHFHNHSCREDRSESENNRSTNSHVDLFQTFQYGIVIFGYVLAISFVAVLGATIAAGVSESSIMGLSFGLLSGGIIFLSGVIGIQYKIIHDAVNDASV